MLLFLLLLQWAVCVGSAWCFVSAAAWTVYTVRRFSERLLALLVLIAGVGTVFAGSTLAFSAWILVQLLTGLNVAGKPKNSSDRVWTIFEFLIFAVYIALSFFTPFAIFAAVAFSPPLVPGEPGRLVDLRGSVVRWVLAVVAPVGAFVSATTVTDWVAASALLTSEIFSAISDVSFRRPQRDADG